MLIGITGTLVSGKDTAAEFFQKKGFQHISLSAILREMVRKQGSDDSVAGLTIFGNQMRKKFGHGFLAKEALKKIKKKNAVISSIRQVGEVKALKSRPDFSLVVVDAPIKIRFARLKSRGRSDDPQTFNEFKDIERKQKTGTKGAMNLEAVFKLADFKVDNSGTEAELNKQLEKILSS